MEERVNRAYPKNLTSSEALLSAVDKSISKLLHLRCAEVWGIGSNIVISPRYSRVFQVLRGAVVGIDVVSANTHLFRGTGVRIQ